MGLRACLERLPAGYDVVEGRRGTLVVRRDYRDALLALDHGPDDRRVAPSSDLAGRRPLGELVVEGERLAIRRFQHGGLMRWMNGERFADPARPIDELILADELRQRGVPTPPVIAARAQRARGFGWRLFLITKRIEDATDSSHVLTQLSQGAIEPALGDRLFQWLGKCVGRLHRVGLLHTDLTPRNMLIDNSLLQGGGGDVWILDLDRCVLRPTLTTSERRSGLRRLLRYVLRRPELSAAAECRHRLAKFMRAYHLEYGHGSSDWRDDWRSIARDAGRSSLLHRAGWALEESVGGGPETRTGIASKS